MTPFSYIRFIYLQLLMLTCIGEVPTLIHLVEGSSSIGKLILIIWLYQENVMGFNLVNFYLVCFQLVGF